MPVSACRDLVRRSLSEDIGRGDVTSELVVPAGTRARGRIVARDEVVLAGLLAARLAFQEADPALQIDAAGQDGDGVQPGGEILRVEGPARSILCAERVALNFLQRLCGIATLAARAVHAVRPLPTVLLDTRKTTPGLRLLEKAAVRAGGMSSHRGGLDDGILIKENHIACAGSAAAAVARARAGAPALLKVEVEIESIADLEPVMEAGADVVLLDNFSVEQVAEAVRQAGDRVLLEASGGITLDSVRRFAETGVHRISLGFVTHSAPSADIALDLAVQGEVR